MKISSAIKLDKPLNRTKQCITHYDLSPDPKHECFDTVLCGVEVEVEKVGSNCDGLHGDVFQVKEDHSLRNNGREIITFPINSPLMMPAVQHIIKNLPAKHDFSLRTSIHFHLNVQDIDVHQLLSILYTYILFERALYRFTHSSRRQSIFCVPIQDTDMFFWAEEMNVFDICRVWHKYSGLNLKPVLEIGTIEFRHLEGTNDVEKISDWFYLLMAMYQHGCKSVNSNIALQNIWKLNTTSEYLQYAHSVFGPWMECLDSKTLESDMAEGVKALKQIRRATSFQREIRNDKESFLYRKVFGDVVVEQNKAKSIFSSSQMIMDNLMQSNPEMFTVHTTAAPAPWPTWSNESAEIQPASETNF